MVDTPEFAEISHRVRMSLQDGHGGAKRCSTGARTTRSVPSTSVTWKSHVLPTMVTTGVTVEIENRDKGDVFRWNSTGGPLGTGGWYGSIGAWYGSLGGGG